MSLSFPNRSRVYDATLRAVRFWGHDGAMEAAFFVNEDALKRIEPGMQPDEAGLLNAFDFASRFDPCGRHETIQARAQGLIRADPCSFLTV
jgi:hypothetical protein